MPSKTVKAKFTHKIEVKEPITLKLFVSADNLKQQGDYLEAFIDLVNKERSQIAKLIIVDTTYLHRHYNPSYGVKVGKSKWQKQNEKILNELRIPFEIVSYHLITEKPEYKTLHKQIKMDFEGDQDGNNIDEAYKEKVMQLAQEFVDKGRRTLEGAIKFILDETAGYIVDSEGYATYPGELNAPVAYALEKYRHLTQNQFFFSYQLRGRSHSPEPVERTSPEPRKGSSSPPGYAPTFFGQSVAYYVDNLHLISPKKQRKFFADLMTLCEKYESGSDSESDNETMHSNGHAYKR